MRGLCRYREIFDHFQSQPNFSWDRKPSWGIPFQWMFPLLGSRSLKRDPQGGLRETLTKALFCATGPGRSLITLPKDFCSPPTDSAPPASLCRSFSNSLEGSECLYCTARARFGTPQDCESAAKPLSSLRPNSFSSKPFKDPRSLWRDALTSIEVFYKLFELSQRSPIAHQLSQLAIFNEISP